MSDLVKFLRARLDDDEAAARAADVKQGDPEWYAAHHIAGHTVRSRRDNRPVARVEDLAGDDDEDVTGILDGRAASEHIARHDPARVLREVEAKRAVIEAHPLETCGDGPAGGCWTCDHDCETGGGRTYGHGPCATVRALAAVYADHPDWDPTWTYARG